MSPKPKISAAEKALFRNTMKNVKPLTHTKTLSTLIKTPKPQPTIKESELTDEDELPPVTGSDFLQFARVGIQHKVLRKLKSAQYTIEAVLDLHGKTIAEAKEALELFLQECQQQHIKYVLMIHGKGQHSGSPILKNRLNHWLRQSKTVMAFCSAKIRHGHTGALYVLLKTLKEE
jgi:DNA-nicking Smr family endonuclease